ncbi:hypothetical protein T484DRAFT_1958370 [Baffinella frigidus]|nr:hypothetical protein T484DRAFT_1958370 [Cryptophyta sp. CCMP2293]
MFHDARYDMLAKSVSEMRELCSKRPDLHAEKQLVEQFDVVMRNLRSQDPKSCAYLHTPGARHTCQAQYEHLSAYPLLSDPEFNLASGWLLKVEPRQAKKSQWPTVFAPRSPSSAGKRDTPKDDVLSAGSNARPLLLRPTRFGDQSCTAPAHARRISWDSNEYLWEFPVAEASPKCFEHPVVASKLPICVKRPLWECEVA